MSSGLLSKHNFCANIMLVRLEYYLPLAFDFILHNEFFECFVSEVSLKIGRVFSFLLEGVIGNVAL